MATANDEVLEVVREMPGLTFDEIANLCTHLPRGTVSSALHVLKLKGQVAVDTVPNPSPGKGKSKRYTKNIYNLGDGTPYAPKTYAKRVKGGAKAATPTPSALQFTVDQQKLRIEELEQWKAEAIARYPDLAVPPLVVQARKLVAEEVRAGGDKGLADAILAGQKDSTLMVKVAIKALESMQ